MLIYLYLKDENPDARTRMQGHCICRPAEEFSVFIGKGIIQAEAMMTMQMTYHSEAYADQFQRY
jgi:hypothetical protein